MKTILLELQINVEISNYAFGPFPDNGTSPCQPILLAPRANRPKVGRTLLNAGNSYIKQACCTSSPYWHGEVFLMPRLRLNLKAHIENEYVLENHVGSRQFYF